MKSFQIKRILNGIISHNLYSFYKGKLFYEILFIF